MPITTPGLSLTADQQEVLTADLGIDLSEIYYLDNDDVGVQSIARCFTNGYVLLFFEGDHAAHRPYLEKVFGADYDPEHEFQLINRGIHAYGHLLARFRDAKYRVTVSTV